MIHTSILNDIDQAFSSFERPLIIYSAPIDGDITKGEYLAIQNDFCNVSRTEMSYQECSMMIIDSPLISDESLCYFCPRLARAVFEENGNEGLLYRRLETIDKKLLNQEQKILMETLITGLKELEQKIEMQEQRELNEFSLI